MFIVEHQCVGKGGEREKGVDQGQGYHWAMVRTMTVKAAGLSLWRWKQPRIHVTVPSTVRKVVKKSHTFISPPFLRQNTPLHLFLAFAVHFFSYYTNLSHGTAPLFSLI